ncbi:hypothetical protein AB1L42_10420 [Thalassoglobus sp. JC818]|uniref:hypothetical protein n=1 Tax=Thalassoglobus sp. JC818 TaxID=3232136 RepID=UPI003458AACF
MTETSAPEANAPKEPKQPVDPQDSGVILISYPKIVFMWPSWVLSIICGIYMVFAKDLTGTGAINIGWAFLIVLSLNLIVLSFDFPRTTSFLVFAVVTALVLGAMLLVSKMPNLIPAVTNMIHSIKPVANAPFYFIFASVLTAIYIAVAILSRFDYWEVRPNELLHHHGVLSDLERFSAPHLRIEKEINDIFEYILLGSGRLILHPSQERRPVVLDNVFFISSKEKRITRLLSALQVRVRDDR